jgi:hypothetical protein
MVDINNPVPVDHNIRGDRRFWTKSKMNLPQGYSVSTELELQHEFSVPECGASQR